MAFYRTERHFGNAILQLAQFLVIKLVAEIVPLAEGFAVVWGLQVVGVSWLSLWLRLILLDIVGCYCIFVDMEVYRSEYVVPKFRYEEYAVLKFFICQRRGLDQRVTQ